MKLVGAVLGLLAVCLCSCSTISNRELEENYVAAMDSLRGSAKNGLIPREEVISRFQLGDKRRDQMLGGARGGYTTSLERWELSNGFSLDGIRHTYVGNETVTPESIDDLLDPDFELEPLPAISAFDTLILRDRREREVDSIRLPRTSRN